MNEIKLFERKDFRLIKEFQKEKPNPVSGIVYAIEYGEGYSKIGMSSVPAERISLLRHYISDYMQNSVNRIMISPWHTNYRQNEKVLHNAFSDCRIPNTELFSVGIKEISDFILNNGLLFEDKSKEIIDEIQRESDALIEFGKSVMRGDYDFQKKDVCDFKDVYDNMLRTSDTLNDEILFITKGFIDDYRSALEDYTESELMKIKSYFVDKWIEHGLLNKNV